jgi:hypothetical protein
VTITEKDTENEIFKRHIVKESVVERVKDADKPLVAIEQEMIDAIQAENPESQ